MSRKHRRVLRASNEIRQRVRAKIRRRCWAAAMLSAGLAACGAQQLASGKKFEERWVRSWMELYASDLGILDVYHELCP